jgi:hypothetical protein
VLDGARVQLGTFGTSAPATDAWQPAETAARRGGRAGEPRAGRRPFAEVAEEDLATQQLAASTRKSYSSHVRAHLVPRFGAVPIADITPAMIGAWLGEQRSADKPLQPPRAPSDAVIGAADRPGAQTTRRGGAVRSAVAGPSRGKGGSARSASRRHVETGTATGRRCRTCPSSDVLPTLAPHLAGGRPGRPPRRVRGLASRPGSRRASA